MTVEHTVDQVSNTAAIIPIHLWPGAAAFYTPRECEQDVISLLKEERALMYEPGEPYVRRVLDLGANVGEFAMYCRMRWPFAWVDCWEPEQESAALCALNAPTGSRMVDSATVGSKYDLVRIDKRFKDHLWVFDGAPSLVFVDGASLVLNESYDLKACGMRRKGEPFQWWQRKRDAT